MRGATRITTVLVVLSVGAGLVGPSLAGPLHQPDGTPIPAGSSLQALFQSLGEPLDAIGDADTMPVAFRPARACVLTELARSGPYHACFGWYDEVGARPGLSDLFQTTSCTDPVGTGKLLVLSADPRYHGGDIGLWQAVGPCASIADPSSILDVGTEKLIVFTEPGYTPGGGEPGRLVHMLVYRSGLNPTTLCFAFEDALAGDHDFDDLVVMFSGVDLADVPGPRTQPPGLAVCPSILTSPEQTARIVLDLSRAGPVTLEVFGLDGRRVPTLVGSAFIPAGRHQVSWDGRDGLGHPVARGLYFVHLQAGSLRVTSRAVIL